VVININIVVVHIIDTNDIMATHLDGARDVVGNVANGAVAEKETTHGHVRDTEEEIDTLKNETETHNRIERRRERECVCVSE
jgi:hypothetical protein